MMRVKAESQALLLHGPARDDAGPAIQRALWTALAPARGPTSPTRASEHFLPLSFYQQIQSLIKGQGEKRGREERRDREVKRAREIDVRFGGRGREQQTTLYLTGEAAARAGAPVCLLPPRLTPNSTPVPASARPMKSFHGNSPSPESEINNLSTSSEEGNL
ncbi:hypothetical protein EXN66_Car001583 [Channa argus]|uniref:Uncharacterized protein n=1 Tax=Channa argus TaxID=215402 RepID=A0A6G1R1N8_CHAAH|nr:hypothetical protein EXN66_Car001583 [Channa argus]KAK2922062.1 hypothetical protein Q8A73_001547 [Channa argus]